MGKQNLVSNTRFVNRIIIIKEKEQAVSSAPKFLVKNCYLLIPFDRLRVFDRLFIQAY